MAESGRAPRCRHPPFGAVSEVPASRRPGINIRGTAGKTVARARTEGVLKSGSPLKTYWSHDLKMPIAVVRVGIGKTWQEGRLDPGARELLSALPEILENAVLTNSEGDRRQRNKFIRAYHMRAAVIPNNKLRRVELVLRHTDKGVHFYLLKETPPTGPMRQLTVANGNVTQNQGGAPPVDFGSHRGSTSRARRSPPSSGGARLHISVLLNFVKPPADGQLVFRSRIGPAPRSMPPWRSVRGDAPTVVALLTPEEREVAAMVTTVSAVGSGRWTCRRGGGRLGAGQRCGGPRLSVRCLVGTDRMGLSVMGAPMPADPRISGVDVAARLRGPSETPNRRRPGGPDGLPRNGDAPLAVRVETD